MSMTPVSANHRFKQGGGSPARRALPVPVPRMLPRIGPCAKDAAKDCDILWRFRWVKGVWSKNSSTLAASKILKFFNADEYREGARDRLLVIDL